MLEAVCGPYHTGGAWGLNFMSEADAIEFLDGCTVRCLAASMLALFFNITTTDVGILHVSITQLVSACTTSDINVVKLDV